MGPGKHCVTYRLRRGGLAISSALLNAMIGPTNWTEQGSAEQALADFDGWHPTLTRLLSQADTLYRWALFDRAPWQNGLTGGLPFGDAAHPCCPLWRRVQLWR